MREMKLSRKLVLGSLLLALAIGFFAPSLAEAACLECGYRSNGEPYCTTYNGSWWECDIVEKCRLWIFCEDQCVVSGWCWIWDV